MCQIPFVYGAAEQGNLTTELCERSVCEPFERTLEQVKEWNEDRKDRQRESGRGFRGCRRPVCDSMHVRLALVMAAS